MATAAALALTVALWMWERGRSEEDAEEVEEDEDEQEVVVLRGGGCAAMRAGAALLAAVASAAATAGKIEGISSGCGLRAGGWRGPAATWRPGGPIRSAAVGEGSAGLRSSPSGFGWAGLLQCVRACVSASARKNGSRGLHLGAGGLGLGFQGCVREACVGHWTGFVCCGAGGRWEMAAPENRRPWLLRSTDPGAAPQEHRP